MTRVAIIAAVAVMLASLSLSSVIDSGGWIVTGAGAVAVVAIAGALSRLPRMPAAVTATFLVLIALVPLLTRPGWADRIAALVILVITALSATGAWPFRGFAVLACYLAALLVYLNTTFAHAASFGHLIPSDSSISALARLWQAAFVEFQGVTGQEFLDAPEHRFLARDVSERQVFGNGRGVELSLNAGIGEDRLDLRSKEKLLSVE